MILPLIMSNTGDMYKNWLAWKKCFLEYMEKNNYTNSEEYKINVLRSLIGTDALQSKPVYHILCHRVDIGGFNTLARKLERLDTIFGEMKNELVERHKFFNRFQSKDESIEIYILDLKEKAKTCNFGYLRDSIIRDKVIANIHSKELRSKLFQTLNLDLATLVHIFKLHEAENKSNGGKIVEKKQTQTDASHSDNIAIVKASNTNNKKIAEREQNSNKTVNANINGKTRKDPNNDKNKTDPNNDKTKTDPKNHKTKTDPKNHKTETDPKNDRTKTDPKNDKTKTDSKIDNSGNNIIGTTNRRHSDVSNKAKTDSKIDNSGNNIIGTANQRLSDVSNKAERDFKIDNSGNIIGTANRRHSDISNKAKTDSKIDNSGNNIIGTANQRRSDVSNKAERDFKIDNSGNIIGTANRRHSDLISNKAKTDSKMDNSDNNLIDFKENYINDKAKIDSKGMNSNHNMSMIRRNSETSCTQYRRKCWRCNDSHAQRCCPAWGYKCEKCGERNHFTNCCQIKHLKTGMQHINMSAKENISNPISCQHENQPKPVPRGNYNFAVNIEAEHAPSAPEFFEKENELYPNLYHMTTLPASEPPNPEATIVNTEPTKTAATETENPSRRLNSEKDKCSIS